MNNESNAQVFPDADIVVPAAELKWWTRPGLESLDLGPTRKGFAQRIQATVATWKNIRPFEGEPELCPVCTPFTCLAIARAWSRISSPPALNSF
jgi:hypothetical protein